jgi:APA family basic amino acid/polyamine antiporter
VPSASDSQQHDLRRPRLSRQVGLFDATMLVMGGIVGSGIFMNPYVVAMQVHTASLILGAWMCGGIIALAGAFIWAELAGTLPQVGGQYAYLREAYHPLLAFLYGWVLLLVIQTGGMAAVSITFARYFLELTHWPVPDWLVATVALAILTIINCLGVRSGSRTQSALMVMKIVAIAALVIAGLALAGAAREPAQGILDRPVSLDLVTAFGAALIPVLFAYGGWQTSSFITGEMRVPRRDLPRALLMGVAGVVALYTMVNLACVRSLGPHGLAETTTPATAVMRLAMGDAGARFIAVAITISTLGFLSQSILTAPRVYFAMAEDGLFFRSVAWLHPHSRVPVLAIVLQSVWTILIALTGRYEQILNYVVCMDFIFFGLTATCIFVFRRRLRTAHPTSPTNTEEAALQRPRYRMPGHPVTTAAFVAVCWLVVANTIYRYPANTLIGMAILVAGVPVYWLWSRQRHNQSREATR